MLGLVQRGGMMAHTTRVRDLQVQYGDVLLAAWPPRWILSHDLGSFLLTAEDGKLTWVEPMPRGIGLWLTRRFDGVAHRGSLLWSGPPSVAELARILRERIGLRIQEVGDVEVSVSAESPADDRAPIALQARSSPGDKSCSCC
jgi:hypothetical protein